MSMIIGWTGKFSFGAWRDRQRKGEKSFILKKQTTLAHFNSACTHTHTHVPLHERKSITKSDLGRGNDRESVHDSVRVFLTDFGDEESAHA